jgi:hypothetical protein
MKHTRKKVVELLALTIYKKIEMVTKVCCLLEGVLKVANPFKNKNLTKLNFLNSFYQSVAPLAH